MDGALTALQSLWAGIGPYAPRVIGALLILIGAWIAARLVRLGVGRVGARLQLDQRARYDGLSDLLASVASGLVWLLSLPALLGTLELQALLQPINAMMSRLLAFLPNVFGAAVVFGIGLLLANIARQVVAGALKAAGSEKVAGRVGLSSALGPRSLADVVASVVFALILLPTLAAGLDALGIDTVTRPVSQLLDAVVSLIPRIVSAALILAIAAMLGRALAGVVSGLLAGMGINRLPGHLGLGADFRAGGRDMSELGGLLVMVGVMFVALAQASDVIGLSMLTQTVATLGGVLAHLVVAVLILLAGLWLAQLAAQFVSARTGERAGWVAVLTRVAVLFFAAALALRQAGLPAEVVSLLFGSVVVGIALGLAIALGVGGHKVMARLLESAVDSLKHKSPDDAPPKAD